MTRDPKSSLTEQPGVSQPAPINPLAQQGKHRHEPSVQELVEGIQRGDIPLLSRAITLIESTKPDHAAQAQQVISACLASAVPSVRIGITGVPGVGKSTFIEAFGKYLTGIGKKVAVLAVDPTSTLSRGSILGDKTRMEELVKDPNAYIRPSASGETLGGVARKTRETIMLCEAAGFDTILVETVGVGQSETAVHGMVDFFLLLQISGAGDELQGIKRGIMEMADAVIINKADGDNVKKARLAKTELGRALHYFPPKASGWTAEVATCSALEHSGIAEVWEMVKRYVDQTEKSGFFQSKRSDQNRYWLAETIDQRLRTHFYTHPERSKALAEIIEKVAEGALSPFAAAQQLLDNYFNQSS